MRRLLISTGFMLLGTLALQSQADSIPLPFEKPGDLGGICHTNVFMFYKFARQRLPEFENALVFPDMLT